MNILFGFLTVILFLDCVVLMFLVLLQLPKKEAGAGMAFGGAATDALFGAGSGNALTTMTQWTAGIFFGLALLMAVMNAHRGKSSVSALTEALTKGQATSGRIVSPPVTAPTGSSNTAGGNQLEATPPAAAIATNAAPSAPGNATAPAPLPSLQIGTNK